MPAPWIVLHEGSRLRWGGDLRRHHVFLELARRTGADLVDGWTAPKVRAAVAARRPSSWQRWRPRPRLASAEMLAPAVAAEVVRDCDAVILDVHDDPLAQHAAFGLDVPSERAVHLRALREANLAAFRLLAVPSASFAELAALPSDRVIVAPNGTDCAHVRPLPLPEAPVVGMVSGAAPGRGIETLVDAARVARSRERDLRLVLWLVATGADSEAFLDGIRQSVAAESWIEVESAPYERLSECLGRAAVLCVPHPAGPYMDAALPVKLFDAMAAGRPLVVTPRVEMRRVVEAAAAGLVAADDSPEGLADVVVRLLGDPALRARLGAAGRAAAEAQYDWRVIGSKLADEVLAQAR